MTLRQIELSGSAGFQETLHPLPHALSSSSAALAHPATLPVMSAQIATILLPVVDKDGEALLPYGIRIPRRQLIDYHDDLYPEVVGTGKSKEEGVVLSRLSIRTIIIGLVGRRECNAFADLFGSISAEYMEVSLGAIEWITASDLFHCDRHLSDLRAGITRTERFTQSVRESIAGAGANRASWQGFFVRKQDREGRTARSDTRPGSS